MSGKDCRLTKEASRKWTRAGFDEPSARTQQPSSPRGGAGAVAVVGVAGGPDRDLEVDLRVGEVVEGLAQVPGLAGGAQQRPGDAQLQQPLAGDDADPFGPVEEDLVAVQQG